MATEPAPQRAYRAACPNCGAPVEFRSASSPFAVCSFCRSTVVRSGDQLRKIGQSAELFDDHTPLQIGVRGTYQGAHFTLLGRLQYRYADGTWNEWQALFETGPEQQKSGWLSEDNGHYVVAFDAPLQTALPPLEQLRVGAALTINQQSWSVASVVSARLIAAEGELPKPPNLEHSFVIVDVRSARGDVGTIDYADPARPGWSIGHGVSLAELALSGLAEPSEKEVAGRTLSCPNCGTALQVKLATTQSIVCHQCKSVIDLTAAEQGNVGGDLAFYAQGNGMEPQIPLGTVGTLALGGPALPWQVVGYAEYVEIAESADDEQSFWREYLLYHRTAGFAFIVDAQDGWSWTVPLTGAPEGSGDAVRYQDVAYRELYRYIGQVTYVLGEFYWQLSREQRTANTDYQGSGAAAAKRLNREETHHAGSDEVVWSGGETMSAETVLNGFRLAPAQSAALQRDALPTSLNSSMLSKVFFWIFIVLVVMLLWRCSSGGGAADCRDTRDTFGEASREYQNCLNRQRSGIGAAGGAFGGYSSGGGHK